MCYDKLVKKPQSHKFNKILLLCTIAIIIIATATLVILIATSNGDTAPKERCQTVHAYSKNIKVCPSDYLGLPHQEALDKAEQDGPRTATIFIDGISQPILGINFDLYFEIEYGKVSNILFDLKYDDQGTLIRK